MFIRLAPVNFRNRGWFAVIAIACSLVSACSTSGPRASAESSAAADSLNNRPGATPPAASPQNNLPQPSSARAAQPTATLAEAQAVLSRIYHSNLAVDTNRPDASFLVGDFNNDGSEDIAITTKPVKGTLPALNSAYAPWTVEDLSKIALPTERNGVRVLPPKPGPVKIEENDELLVIVHGYQQSGWRNPQAQQTYLLRHAVGDGLQAQPIKNLLSEATRADFHRHIGGDVIQSKLAGQEGFVYWSGAKYVWYGKKP